MNPSAQTSAAPFAAGAAQPATVPLWWRLACGHAAVLALAIALAVSLLEVGAALLDAAWLAALPPLLVAIPAALLFWQAQPRRDVRPEGQLLRAEDAPHLFRTLAKLRRRLGSPRLAQVVIDDSFSVGLRHSWPFGFFGPARHTLVVGLPVMQMLSRRELCALVAQTLAAHSHRRGRRACLTRHLLDAWQAPATTAPRRRREALLHAWLDHLAPHARTWEAAERFEADGLAGEIVGRQTLGDALVALELRTRFMQNRFWQGLWARADHLAAPPFLPHATMRAALGAGLTHACAQTWLDELLRPDATPATPQLRERLQALRALPEAAPEAVHSAAQSLLGETLTRLQQAFDQRWLELNASNWRLRFHSATSARETVRRMQGRDSLLLGPEELAHYGLALDTLGRPDEALPLLCRAATHANGSAEAAFAAARLLHARDAAESQRFLALAHQRDPASRLRPLERRGRERSALSVMNRAPGAESA
ncbi:MAG: hypothetical protein REI09_06400 [Candidatus Dactylopiibacterium sp.]|nr:hypothetical protein [Candidatus Dactylopiibacterium sp.]